MVGVWIHRLENVVRDRHNNSVHLQPIIQSFILLFVKLAELLVLHLFEFLVRLSILFQTRSIDTVHEGAFDLAATSIFKSCTSSILKLHNPRFRSRILVSDTVIIVSAVFEIARTIFILRACIFTDVRATMPSTLISIPLSSTNHRNE